MSNDDPTFAALLRRLRADAGFARPSDLANAAGLSTRMIQYLEAGKRRPGVRTLVALADVLNCPVRILLTGFGPETSEESLDRTN